MKIIKFYQNNCAPCTMVQQYLSSKRISAEKINPFEQPEMAIKYNISSVPVTILLDAEGNEVKRVVGFKPPELDELIAQLNQ